MTDSTVMYDVECGGCLALCERPWANCIMWVDAHLDKYTIVRQKNGEAKVMNSDGGFFCRICPSFTYKRNKT